jgi:aryl-alcohol dehydrogenase (NADP+)
MFAWKFLKALHVSEKLGLERFVSMQNYYNLLYREEEREMIPLCKEEGVAVIPWSPLARGFLSGKYKRGDQPKGVRYETEQWNGHSLLAERYFKPEDFDVVEVVTAIAKEKQVTPSQVALAWLFHKGVTSPIIGATRVEHVEEAAEALEVKLDEEDIRRLEAPYKPQPVTGHD